MLNKTIAEEICEAYSKTFLKGNNKKQSTFPTETQKTPQSKHPKVEIKGDGPNVKNVKKPVKTQKICDNTEKTIQQNINNFMNKSLFDKLFENAMSDEEALGLDLPQGEEGEEPLDAGFESDESEDFGGEGDVTVTLDRATAEKLIEVLNAAIGGVSEEEGEEDFGGEEDFSDDDEFKNDEFAAESSAIETVGKGKTESAGTKLPRSKFLNSKENKVQGHVKAGAAKHGDGKVTDKVGNAGGIEGKGKALMGKDNKVAGRANPGKTHAFED